MAQNTLSDEVKTFIVQQLACFDTPSTVAKAVKDEFDIDVTRQQVEAYDPNKYTGRDLSEGYRQIFAASREAFLKDTAAIGIAHRSVRLRTLQRAAHKAEEMRNLPLVASLLEQAAKEVGDAYTNRREFTGKGGGAIQVIATTMTPKEAADAYGATLHSDA